MAESRARRPALGFIFVTLVLIVLGFGILGAAFGLGFVIGPAVGGLLGQFGLRVPFFAAAVCVGLNWLYGAFVLPESLSLAHRKKFEWRRANPVGALLNLRRFHGIG